MNQESIRNILYAHRDPKYADFIAKLIPTLPKERFIGIRSPEYKKIVKELPEEAIVNEFLNTLPHFFYEENTNRIYFHGSKLGQKAEALKKSDKVCFTAYGNEQIKKEDWAPYLQSVVIFGRCHPIQDFELLRKFGKKYYPDHILLEKEIEAFKEKVQLYEITIEHISGKQIQEK